MTSFLTNGAQHTLFDCLHAKLLVKIYVKLYNIQDISQFGVGTGFTIIILSITTYLQ
jgi:S-ribosylhomocysteine lyase LuxS involved in autoinducer biosynthesis